MIEAKPKNDGGVEDISNNPNLINDLNHRLSQLEDLFYRTHNIDKDIFSNPVYLNNKILIRDNPSGNKPNTLSTGKTNGVIFGIDSNEKIGFYGKTPIIQQTNTAGSVTASGTYTTNEQKMLNDAYSVLRNFGLLS